MYHALTLVTKLYPNVIMIIMFNRTTNLYLHRERNCSGNNTFMCTPWSIYIYNAEVYRIFIRITGLNIQPGLFFSGHREDKAEFPLPSTFFLQEVIFFSYLVGCLPLTHYQD